MSRVIAALDNSMAARPALSAAVAAAGLFEAEVEAFHVCEDGDRIVRGIAEAAGYELKVASGPVIERLTEVAEESDVVAVVMGARRTPGARRPLGSTAHAVVTALSKPVVVVPPDARRVEAFRSVLVPVEGATEPESTPIETVLASSDKPGMEVIVLHVFDESTLPSFTDQPQHEHDAWAREFLRRQCPWEAARLRLEIRRGRSEDVIPLMVRETAVDMVVLCWAQEIGEGRAPIVRTLLSHGQTPVMLVPAPVAATTKT
jgi:nucleotide-binding universal stress UspA family protein